MVGENGRDLVMDNDTVKNCKSFNYLGVTLFQMERTLMTSLIKYVKVNGSLDS